MEDARERESQERGDGGYGGSAGGMRECGWVEKSKVEGGVCGGGGRGGGCGDCVNGLRGGERGMRECGWVGDGGGGERKIGEEMWR